MFFPHFRLHEEQKEMDISAIYSAVDIEGENKQYLERFISSENKPNKKKTHHAYNRVFSLFCGWSNCQVNAKTLSFGSWIGPDS